MKRVAFSLAVAAMVVGCLVGAFLQSKRVLEALFAIDSTKVSESVVALTAIGLLTMALPIRAWYHEGKVRSWLSEEGIKSLHGRLQIEDSPTAFYDLPIQSICGQIAAVAEAVLVEEVGSIEWSVSSAALNAGNYATPDKVSVSALLKDLAGPGAKDDLKELKSKEKGLSPDLIRARLGSHIQRNIDNLQITAGTRWRRGLRFTAFILSSLLSASLLVGLKLGWQQVFALLGAALLAGLIGGYLASVFRDLVAVIERLRHP